MKLERAVVDLRYGTVAFNHWPALGYAFGTTPWGGHQSATLRDIQSGLGWVHNPFMLAGIDDLPARCSGADLLVVTRLDGVAKHDAHDLMAINSRPSAVGQPQISGQRKADSR